MRPFALLSAVLLSPLLSLALPTGEAPNNSTATLVAEELKARQARAAVISRCTVPNTVALTFDDGPYWYTRQIAEYLTNNGAKGTFFVNGNNWACIYNQDLSNMLKWAYDRGHQIASHTWAHRDLTTLSWDQIHDEMWRVELAVMRITGAYVAFMRPPYGNYNNLVLEASAVRGQDVVLWDVDTGDSVGASLASQQAQYDSIVSRHPSTALTLQHEVHWSTANQLVPYAVQRLKAAGYRLVTVAECLGRSPYQWVGQPHTRDGSWTC